MGGIAPALAIRTPPHDYGYLLGANRTEYINVDGHPIAQGNGDVLVHDDIDGQWLEAWMHLEASVERSGTRLEATEQALPTFLIAVSGDEYRIVLFLGVLHKILN